MNQLNSIIIERELAKELELIKHHRVCSKLPFAVNRFHTKKAMVKNKMKSLF